MIVEKRAKGVYYIAQVVRGRLVSRLYFYYSRKEAISRFREVVREVQKTG